MFSYGSAYTVLLQREIDRDGVLSFFHPKNYLKPCYEDVDDPSKNRNKAIAKMQQDLMRKQAHLISAGSLHEMHDKRTTPMLHKNGNFQLIPEIDSDSSKYEVCFECGSKKDKVLIPCVMCQTIKFCSEECYKKSIGKDTLHRCQFFSFTDIQQILEAMARALLEQEQADLANETDMQLDGKELPEMIKTGTESRNEANEEVSTTKQKMSTKTGTESRKESNEEVSTTKLKKTTSDEGEKLFDGKKDKKKRHKEKEELNGTEVTTQKERKQQESKMSKVAVKTDKEVVKGKFVNGELDSSVKNKEEDNVKGEEQSAIKVTPSVALVLNFGADNETSFDRLPLPYVVLRDGCLYYRVYGSKPQLLENYSLL